MSNSYLHLTKLQLIFNSVEKISTASDKENDTEVGQHINDELSGIWKRNDYRFITYTSYLCLDNR